MKLHIAPECRILDIPSDMTIKDLAEWLDKSGLRLRSNGELWVEPKQNHPRTRMGDFMAMMQDHPSLVKKHSYSTVNGYVCEGQDRDYLYKLVVIEK